MCNHLQADEHATEVTMVGWIAHATTVNALLKLETDKLFPYSIEPNQLSWPWLGSVGLHGVGLQADTSTSGLKSEVLNLSFSFTPPPP